MLCGLLVDKLGDLAYLVDFAYRHQEQPWVGIQGTPATAAHHSPAAAGETARPGRGDSHPGPLAQNPHARGEIPKVQDCLTGTVRLPLPGGSKLAIADLRPGMHVVADGGHVRQIKYVVRTPTRRTPPP